MLTLTHTLTHAYTSHTQNYEPANTVYNQVETTMCVLVYTYIQRLKGPSFS